MSGALASPAVPTRAAAGGSGGGAHPLGSRRARHLVGRNLRIYRHGWYFVVTGAVEPLFYLASVGIGLSHLVGPVEDGGRRLAYTLFAAPALLAVAAMNGALVDTTYNVFHRLKVAKSYEAVLATPLSPGDVALGEIGWSVLRGAFYSACFLAAMAGFGYVGSWWALCCLPAAVLVATAFAAAGMAATSYLRTWADLDNVAFLSIPLFLFSGTFYPVSVYPGWLAELVRLSPLYQGVVLERGLDNGLLSPLLAARAAYLAAMSAACLAVVARRLKRTLAP